MSLIRRENLEELVARRDQVMAMYEKCANMLEEVDVQLRATVDMVPHNNYKEAYSSNRDDGFAIKMLHPFKPEPVDAYVARARRLVDGQFWSHLLILSGIENVMDKQAHQEYRKAMEIEPPVFSLQNASATLEKLISDSQMMVARGIATAFSSLDRQFKSNTPFKFGRRMIINHALSYYGFNVHVKADQTIHDVERVFATLDGCSEAFAQGGYTPTVDAMREAMRESRGSQWTITTKYFKIRGFKKGTIHVWFERKDLIDEVNKILASYYGAALDTSPDVYHADPLAAQRFPVVRARNYGFYPTPQRAASALLRHVEPLRWVRDHNDQSVQKPYTILEPSAGTGNLVYGLAKKGAVVDCVEYQRSLAKGLSEQGVYRNVWCRNFLEMQPNPIYDYVVMNPPFGDDRDAKHVRHAHRFLNKDGALYAVMSAGIEYRQTPAAIAFRQWYEALCRKHRRVPFYEELPPGSFRESGTNVNTVIVKIMSGSV